MENIIANVAQLDNDVRTERCVGGMPDAAREGRYVWLAPIGYDNVRVNGKANIAQNEKMAPLVLQAFVSVAENKMPISEVYRNSIKCGLVTRKNKPISKAQFYDLFKNELYIGLIKKFGESHIGHFQPIVSEEIFKQVQRVLRLRSHSSNSYRKENPDFPLRRFIRNSSGDIITGSWSKGRKKKYPYYRFRLYSKSFPKGIMEYKFKVLLNSYRLYPRSGEGFLKYIKKVYLRETQDCQKKILTLKKSISELELKQKQLVDKNLNGVISDTIYQEHSRYLETEIMEANAELIRLTNTNIDIDELISFSREYLKNPSKIWDEIAFEQKLALQWFNFPQGIVFEEGKFRTAEISSIFKVNSLFLPSMSGVVDFSFKKLNHQTLAKKASRCGKFTLHTKSRNNKIR